MGRAVALAPLAGPLLAARSLTEYLALYVEAPQPLGLAGQFGGDITATATSRS